MIDWALTHNKSHINFVASCLTARQSHRELNTVITGLFYEVANIGRNRQMRAQDSSNLVELFSRILPRYFSALNFHEYYELVGDLISSHHYQFEKDRLDKQHLLFDMTDACLNSLSL